MALEGLHNPSNGPNGSYVQEAIALVEASENTNYAHSNAVPVRGNLTIGYGLDLAVSDWPTIRFLLLQALGFTAAANSGTSWEDVPGPIEDALNAIQIYNSNPGSATSSTIIEAQSLSLTQAQAQSLLAMTLEGDSNSADTPPPTFQSTEDELSAAIGSTASASLSGSVEGAVLLSLEYQQPVYIGNNTKAALASSGEAARANLWYDIRYGDNGNPIKVINGTPVNVGNGIAKRMYLNSALVDLYGSSVEENGVVDLTQAPKSVSDNDAVAIYQMFTAHHDTMLQYDQLYGAQVAAANSDYVASIKFGVTVLNWADTFMPAFQYLQSLFKGKAEGVSEDNVWAAPDATGTGGSLTITPWQTPLSTGDVMIVGGTTAYSGNLWASTLDPTNADLFLVGNSGQTVGQDNLSALGEVDSQLWSAPSFQDGQLQLSLQGSDYLLVNLNQDKLAFGSDSSTLSGDLSSTSVPSFTFGSKLPPAASGVSTWELSSSGNAIQYRVSQDPSVTLLSGSNDVLVDTNETSAGPALALAPEASSLFIGLASGAAIISDNGQQAPAVVLGLGEGNTLQGNEGDTLVAAGNDETFEVNAGGSGGSGGASAVPPVTTMIGGAIDGSASTGDIFDAGLTDAVMIGGTGTNTFNFDFVGDYETNDVDVVWGGGGTSTYDFSGVAQIVVVNMPQASVADVAGLKPSSVAADVFPISEGVSFTEDGPIVVIIDPTAADKFEIDGNTFSGGGLTWYNQYTNEYLYSGLKLVDATPYTDTLGASYTNLLMEMPTDSIAISDFTNGFAGIDLTGGLPAGQSYPSLASASADGEQLSSTPGGTNVLLGNGYDVTYNVTAASTPSDEALEASLVEASAASASLSELTSIYNGGSGAEAPHSTLAFGSDVDPLDVAVTYSSTDSQNIVFTDTVTGQTVNVVGGLIENRSSLAQVTFADGTSWSYADVLGMLESPTISGAITGAIDGDTTANVLDSQGLVGVDIGNGGGDTFIFNSGYGQLEVEEQDANASNINTLQIGAGITPSQATLTSDGTNVYLSLGGSDEVSLEDMALGGGNGVEQITFADGTAWSEGTIASMLATGTTGNNELYGIAPGQTFDGKGGSDYEQGQGGGDTFVFHPGYGQLEVSEYDPGSNPSNTLQFGAGIDPSDITASISSGSIILQDGAAGDQVTLDNMVEGSGFGVQEVSFADGITWTRTDVLNLFTTGTAGDDQLYGLVQGQTFDGRGGSDYEQGLGGGDTFIFDQGYGQLEINEQDATASPDNTLALGAGIDPSQVTLTATATAVYLSDGIAGDEVTLDGMTSSAADGVQQITFADGTTWNRAEIASMLTNGTTGSDKLYGVAPGQTFDGKGGSDYEQGIGGGDTFIFEHGYGQLEIDEQDNSANPDNTLALGVGIGPPQVTLTASASGVYLSDGVAGDEVTLDGMTSSPADGVQQITFADGTTWSRAEIASMLATGTTGNDQLYGIAPGQTFDGEGGSDYEQGLGGGDTFLFNPSYGQLEINEQDSSTNPDNTLALGAGIDPSQVTLTATASAVYLTDGVAGDEVTLDGMTGGTANGVQQITFADGTTWSRAEIANMLTTGTTGNDQLFGITSGLTFDGKGGSDYEQSLGRGNTFIFNADYGQLEIQEAATGYGLSDTVALGAGISRADVTLQANDSTGALIILDGVTGDSITVDNDLSGGWGVTSRLGEITFADGSEMNLSQGITFTWGGSATNASLVGSGFGANAFDVASGDTVTFGNGSLGGSRNNTLNYGSGDGSVTVNTDGGTGSVAMAPGITQSDVILQADDSTGNLTILDGTTGDSIVVDNDLSHGWGVVSQLADITFADGSTINLSQPITFTWNASASTTSLTGSGFGDNVFNLAPGGDSITFGSASNQVVYAAGNGAVSIDTNGGSGSIVMAAGITQSDIILQADDSTGNLTILDGTTGDSIVIDNDLHNDWGVSSRVSDITFSDGSLLNLGAPLTFTWTGSATTISLTGSGYGANLFNLAPGGDSVTFGNGSQGGSDSNLVNYAAGDGAVTIDTNGGTGSIAMAAGITQSDITLQADDSTGNLTILDGTNGDSIVVDNDLSNNWGVQSQLSDITFSDGSTLDLTQPLTFTWSGSASETSLTGSGYGANVFNLAPGGDSVTFGNGWGSGSNSNLVNFAAGDGAVTIDTNGGTGSIAMAAGISQNDLALQSDSSGDLTVFVGSTSDSLTIASDINGSQSTISQISFSDGTVVTGSQLVDLVSLSTSYQAAAGEAPDLPTLSLMDTAYLSGTSVSQIDTAISSEFSGSGPSTPTVSPVVDEQPVALGNTLLPFATTTLADSNSQQVDIATVTLSAGNGSLSNLGSGVLTNGGLTYTASGSAADVQADLQGLTLTPASGAAGSTSSLGLTVSNLSGGSVSASVDVPIQAAGSTSGLAFIYGSADNNALTATGNPDQFAFADLNMGAASISGFDPSADVLQLSRSQFADFSTLQNSLSDTSGGAMISIDPNNSILLKNVTVASLHASDFQFA